MKIPSYFINKIIIPTLIGGSLLSCGDTHPSSTNPGKYSTATGARFNEKGGFQVLPFNKQQVGPGMVFVDGGSTIMGIFGESANNGPKREVTVTSFYMKETEVTNIEWNEFLSWLLRTGKKEAYRAAQPNNQVWVRDLGYNDPYVESYSKHPGFRFYPVVGITWVQANEYCKWLTKFMNNKLSGEDEEEADEDQNEGEEKEDMDINQPIESSGDAVASFRLPTEAEWEYAARAIVGVQNLELVQASQPVYPWGDGLSLRGQEGPWKGKYMANFKRNKGNYKGVPGETGSSAPTTDVYAYPPNSLNIYDMGGNVSEWVMDMFRPGSSDQFDDFNPIRRDDTLDSEKNYDQEHSLINNKARVFKGASWKDSAYWAQIGTRRYLDEDSCAATIGFRYVTNSMGDSHLTK